MRSVLRVSSFVIAVAMLVGACSTTVADPTPIKGSGFEDSSTETTTESETEPETETDTDTGGGPGAGEGGDQSAEPKPERSFDDVIHVSPVIDEEAAQTARIDRAGGEVTATGPDGTTYTLTVPAGALAFGTEITISPLASIDGLPYGDGASYGVDLQPSGLEFFEPAVLSIETAEPIPAEEQVPFSYSGADAELGLAVLASDADRLDVVVSHFSGYGVQRGFYGHTGEVLDRVGGDVEARIGAEIQQILGEMRLRNLEGLDPDPSAGAQIRELLREYEEAVVKPRLEAAGESCDAGMSVLRSVLSHRQQVQFLLGDSSMADAMEADIRALAKAVISRCIDEEYRMCVDEHIVHRMLYVWLEVKQTLAWIVGEGEAQDVIDKAAQLTESCLTFELEFTTRSDSILYVGEVGIGRSIDNGTVTFPVKFSTSEAKFVEATAPFTTHDAEVDQSAWLGQGVCTFMTHSWTGDARFVDLGWDVAGGASLADDFGEVTDIRLLVDIPVGEVRNLADGHCGGIATVTGITVDYVYDKLHDAGDPVEGWDVAGGETYATAEWEGSFTEEHLVMNETGSATLRHTPGA